MTTGSRQVLVGVMISIVLSSRPLPGQIFRSPTRQQGTTDAELWLGGVAAQHDGTTSFNTEIWTGGVRLGRILTAPHGPGWLRGTLQWDVDFVPLFVVSNLQTAYGAEIDPVVGRWNFNRHGRTAPYLEMAGGILFTNSNIPPGHTSNFNVTPNLGFGWQIFRRGAHALDFGVHVWHLSNAWTAPRNPSLNGIQLTIGYHWFRLTSQTAGRNHENEDDARP